MRHERVPGGVVHELPADLREALLANATALRGAGIAALIVLG